MEDYCRLLLEDFLKTSFSTVKVLVEGVAASKGQNTNRKVTLFRYVDGKKVSFPFSDERFYLRGRRISAARLEVVKLLKLLLLNPGDKE